MQKLNHLGPYVEKGTEMESVGSKVVKTWSRRTTLCELTLTHTYNTGGPEHAGKILTHIPLSIVAQHVTLFSKILPLAISLFNLSGIVPHPFPASFHEIEKGMICEDTPNISPVSTSSIYTANARDPSPVHRWYISCCFFWRENRTAMAWHSFWFKNISLLACTSVVQNLT